MAGVSVSIVGITIVSITMVSVAIVSEYSRLEVCGHRKYYIAIVSVTIVSEPW